MSQNIRKISWLVAMLMLAVIAGCAEPTVQLPTQDLDLLRTEVAQTVLAESAKQTAMVPIATTQVAPSPSPTVTQTATTSVGVGGTGTGSGTGSSGGGYSAGTPIPTWTPVIYKAQYIESKQYPLDGFHCGTGDEIDVTWTLKNIGLATWDTTYYYKVLQETVPIAKKTLYMLKEDVPSGKELKIVVDIVCPTTIGGPYSTEWGLVNDNGEVFAKFWFGFYTVAHTPVPPTPTRTQSPG